MELVYTIARKTSQRRDWRQEETSLCRLSSSNIIAFCSTAQLDKEVKEDVGAVENLYHVYVCDIDKPWQVYKVVSCRSKVVALEWHVSGTRLLIATSAGKCQIWHMTDYMLNKWEMETSADLPGEEVLAIAWFHQGSKSVLNGDKKESPLYLEKISKMYTTPTVTQFGGRPLDGWLAITASGMIGVAIPKNKESKMMVKMESLVPGRMRLSTADIAFSPTGEVGIITSDGQISSCILCFMASIKVDQGCISINSKAAPSIYMHCHTSENALKESPSTRVTHVRFMKKDCTESVVIAAGDHGNSHIELWNLNTESVRLNRFFSNKNPGQDSSYQTQKWVYHSSIHHGSIPISIAIPRFPIVYQVTDVSAQMFQYVAVGYKDGSVKLVNKATFMPMATTNLDMGLSEAPSEKRRKTIAHLSVMEQTVSGCALVGVDQFNTMYVMKVVNTRDPVTQVSPLYLVGLLEYNIVAGYDWWDVLAALKLSVMEGVCQKLQDNFNKQPSVLQDLYLSRFMAIKGSLYRCSNSQQYKAADCHCILVLHCIKSHFNMILRPKGMASIESGPIEKLGQTCQKTTEADLDKVVVSLSPENKEFVVEHSSLQSLQPLVQWVADVSLYLLASVTNAQGYNSFPGASLLHDASVLLMLREMLVVAYIWGMVTPSCLPHLTQSSAGTDCMQRLFSLITQLWVKAKDGSRSSADFDDALVDECCLLASHLTVPLMDQGMFGNTQFHKNIFLQNHPVKFTYGEAPGYMTQDKPVVFSADGQPPAQQSKDVVRLINLGVMPPDDLRVCSRCGCCTMAEGAAKVAALGSWDGKWQRQCLCGGLWVFASENGGAGSIDGNRMHNIFSKS